MSSQNPSKLMLIALAVVTAALALFSGPAATPTLADSDVVPGHYIIQLAPNQIAAAVANEMARDQGLGVSHVYGHALNGFAAQVPAGRLNALQNDPRVLTIVEDRVVSIAHHCKGNHSCDPTPTPTPDPDPDPGSQVIPTGIRRVYGHLSSTQSGNGSGTVNIDVAIIDTGIDLGHADLNVVGGRNCSRGTSYNDGNGHGTHVAGTVAAYDNDFGVVGIAPGARLWAVRVLDNSGSGTWASVICGVDFVTANAGTIKVANMSLGGSGSQGHCNDGGLRQAICQSVAAGVTYVAAAGNSATNAAGFVPASYPEVITVSALADFDGLPGGLASPTCRNDEDDTFANFSNYGSVVDIIAPGVCINSTWRGGGYNTISGTSMAAPHVAGAAALVLANNGSMSPAEVRNTLVNSGNFDWNNSDDPDGIKEPLLDVRNH
jgi:subtilisin